MEAINKGINKWRQAKIELYIKVSYITAMLNRFTTSFPYLSELYDHSQTTLCRLQLPLKVLTNTFLICVLLQSRLMRSGVAFKSVRLCLRG